MEQLVFTLDSILKQANMLFKLTNLFWRQMFNVEDT